MLDDIIDQIFLGHGKYDHAPTTMAADTEQPATCPVDHKSREAWLDKTQAAAAAAAAAATASSSTDSPARSLPPSHPPIGTGSSKDTESCPVDHGAREVWLQQARAASSSSSSSSQTTTNVSSPATTTQSSSWSSYLPRIPFLSSSSSSSSSPASSHHTTTPPPGARSASHLGIDREVSTIPRTSFPLASGATKPDDDNSGGGGGGESSSHGRPLLANNEQETGADKATGNWIYPSERMFFDAMKRKGHDPRAADMRTVVPIHNAVNERAWAEIKGWEGPWIQGSSCGGPRLHSFSGLSTHMSPKARFNTFLGYQAPFDRHDWVVDRCGKEIEYVIDFYAGRNASNGADGKLSFYLDVRPKLNSWEGVKMRAFRAVGLA